MFNPSYVVANAFGEYLEGLYQQHFSGRNAEYAAYIGGAARLVLERLGNTDALYHNAEHTMMVTLVGQQILRGRLVSEAVQPEDWLHFTLALLIHDIGYVRGICRGDRNGEFVIGLDNETIAPPRGISDAFLAPYHVERGMIYARERFGDSKFVDEERLVAAIDYTRFPIPKDEAYAETNSERALVRAADLIGQLGDPFYYRKINALYHEFAEVGTAEKLGYTSPIDLLDRYPEFFWSQVNPCIGPALRYLELTVDGKQWVAHLYNHVFQARHRTSDIGPFPGLRQNAPA
ncbi:MAG: metal-dependent phosphohydrolase [Ahrensia sp.]|nr:metal-dependent phosphohydrolase [Ahrensia sp.]|tara:strand:+ start:4244 stop:5113 length:870 start_codon:yes stop_codon:yes gene_type:complete